MNFGVVILAAGASRRMNRPKLLLPWAGTSVLGHLISLWQDLGAAQISVVCAGDSSPVAEELGRLSFPTVNRLINPDPGRGMFSSIQTAARWSGWEPNISHLILVLGDQPQISPSTLRVLLAHVDSNPRAICQPAFQGRPKHPVALPRELLRELSSSEAPTLAHFLDTVRAVRSCVEIADPALALDLDYPEDYQRLLSLAEPVTPPTDLRPIAL